MSEPNPPGTSDLEQKIDAAAEAVSVQVAELDELEEGPAGSAGALGMQSLLGVRVEVTVQVGRTRLSIAELARLGPGSLVTLDREAHEPADVLVNGSIVARGEIVTLGDVYGVRITEVCA
jgi:flagellar motor switch protein FliN/FliY